MICQPPAKSDRPGFGFVGQPPGAPGWWLHARIPDPTDPRSAIVSEAVIPAKGGVVTIDSGGRIIRERFLDIAALDARIDAEAGDALEELRLTALRGLRTPSAQARLHLLDPRDRRVLTLRVERGLSHAEVQAQTGMGSPEVRRRLSRAIRTLGIDLHGMQP